LRPKINNELKQAPTLKIQNIFPIQICRVKHFLHFAISVDLTFCEAPSAHRMKIPSGHKTTRKKYFLAGPKLKQTKHWWHWGEKSVIDGVKGER